MGSVIRLGGTLVIVTVFLIMAFLVAEVLPLFSEAQLERRSSHRINLQTDVVAIASDDFGELPALILKDGRVAFVDTVHREGHVNRGIFAEDYPHDSITPTVVEFSRRNATMLTGTDSGEVAAIKIGYETVHSGTATGTGPSTSTSAGTSTSSSSNMRTGGRVVQPKVSATSLWRIGDPALPVTHIGFGDSGRRQLFVVAQGQHGRRALRAAYVDEPQTLLAAGKPSLTRRFELDHFLLDDQVRQILVPFESDAFIVLWESGVVTYYTLDTDGEFSLSQRFSPLANAGGNHAAVSGEPAAPTAGESHAPTVMEFVRGDYSIVFGNDQGAVETYGLFRDAEQTARRWDLSQAFEDLPGPIRSISQNGRNKVFLVATPHELALKMNTTGTERGRLMPEYTVASAAFSPSYSTMLALDTDNILHLYTIDDPHPQASLRTYFSRIRYEGQSSPEYYWQSSGGTNDFEPKLSMVPLIFGTLKGTLYAMLFSLPIALLAAVYTSQFLKPAARSVVKPAMEMMASVPSVVLGFLGALWLAPLLSNSVPSIIMMTVFTIVGVVAVGVFARTRLSTGIARYRGLEFALLLPVFAICGWAGWWTGGQLEELLFRVVDTNTGAVVGNFRLWITNVVGIDFEQRNQLVVGFAMGFAVIPVIYTIAEDALSNVPQTLRAGSLALGASRWQTAVKVVVPTAAAGIFSAVMIGLGRAVGETMIVVMATGNVPTTDLNIFTGMRTLSANIAVELPEATHRGTLYRSLFLGALLLFGFTFILNTIAELFRQRLRDRYRAME